MTIMKPEYWYLFKHEYCAICGSEFLSRYRVYGVKPKEKKHRHIYCYMANGCCEK